MYDLPRITILLDLKISTNSLLGWCVMKAILLIEGSFSLSICVSNNDSILYVAIR